MRKVSIVTVRFSLFLVTILANIISRASSLPTLTWTIYSIIIGVAFTSLKLWNKTLQEPILDVNLTFIETSISIILAIMVSAFGGALFQLNSLRDSILTLLLAFVMTTCQYTLLKVSAFLYQMNFTLVLESCV